MSDIQSYVPGQFCWAEVAVKDARRAKAFYEKLFGWKPNDVPMDAGSAYTLMKLKDRDVCGLYELSKEQVGMGVPPHWMTYVAVESADRAVEQAKQLGAQVMMPPFDVMNHGRMAVLADPQGASFSVWQAKEHKGTLAVNEEGTPGWCELATKDVAKAKEFYSKLFGWTLDSKSKDGMEYTEIIVGGRHIGGMMTLMKEHGPVPPHWLIYFVVGDCDERVRTAQQNGGSIVVPPMDIPTVGRFAVLSDPSGASFAVIKLAFTGEHAEKAAASGKSK